MNERTPTRSFWQSFSHLPLLIVGCIAALLYLSGLGSFLFLVPYAWLLSVHKDKNIAIAAVISIGVVAITRLIQSAQILVITIELLTVGSLLLTLFSLATPFKGRLWYIRGLYRMLIPVMLFMAFTLPFAYNRINDPQFLRTLTDMLTEILNRQGDGAVPFPIITEERMQQLITNTLRILCGVYVGFYMLLPIVSWGIIQVARLLSPRLFRRAPIDYQPYAFEQFRLPQSMIWIVITQFASALLLFALSIETIVSYIYTNILAILAILYTMTGFALIMRIAMRRYSRIQTVRGVLIISLVTLLIPIINSIMLIAVGILGLSQTWIDYDTLMLKKADNE